MGRNRHWGNIGMVIGCRVVRSIIDHERLVLKSGLKNGSSSDAGADWDD